MTIVTPFFAAILAMVYLALSLNVSRYRISHKISLGSGDNRHLRYAIRAHANFIEYVPLSLLLIWFLESLTLSAKLPFWLGAVLLTARVAHALGLFYPRELFILRQIGSVATLSVLLVASAAILLFYLPVSI